MRVPWWRQAARRSPSDGAGVRRVPQRDPMELRCAACAFAPRSRRGGLLGELGNGVGESVEVTFETDDEVGGIATPQVDFAEEGDFGVGIGDPHADSRPRSW